MESAFWKSVAESSVESSPPQAPSDEDIRFYESILGNCVARRESGVRALVLGVTPAILGMDWAPALSVTAVDASPSMIKRFWKPPRDVAETKVEIGNWLRLPIADASLDFVVGDGCYSVLPGFEGAVSLNQEVARVLQPGGVFCTRLFCLPDSTPTLDELFASLSGGNERDLDLFRWRLVMAIYAERRPHDGLCIDEAWRVWSDRIANPKHVPGWRPDAIARFERWAGSDERISYLTIAEIQEAAAPLYDVEEVSLPSYPDAQRFPRFVMRKLLPPTT